MKTSSILLSAAVAGITMGIAACASATPPQAQSSDNAAAEAKHACKGQNACKGQGGCKTDAHACKGQNACKGQGGCKG